MGQHDNSAKGVVAYGKEARLIPILFFLYSSLATYSLAVKGGFNGIYYNYT